jgi:predicted nucleic acid-binding protein
VKIVIDSYAWIELFLGSNKGQKVKEALEAADQLYTPDVVLAEIARKYHREGFEEAVIKSRLEQIAAVSNIFCLDPESALESAACYKALQENASKSKLATPGLFDAIILAAGRVLHAKILTSDLHFKDLAETMWI